MKEILISMQQLKKKGKLRGGNQWKKRKRKSNEKENITVIRKK